MGCITYVYLFVVLGGILFTAGGFFVQPRSQAPMFFIIGAVLMVISAIWTYFMVTAPAKEAEQKRLKKLEEHSEEEKKQKELASLRGLDKYLKMNDDEISAYNRGIEAMRTLGIIMQQSVYQEKEKDWAILGGIADGIAGPVAGIATAAQAMQDNVRIREENEARRQWGAQQNAYMHSLAAQAEADCPPVLYMKDLQKMFRADFWKKPADFLSLLNLETVSTTADPDCGAVTVKASWSRKENICVDGAVRAMLYDEEDQYLGCAYLVLPKIGTAKSSGEISGVCASPASSNVARVEYEAVSLWELASAAAPMHSTKYDPKENEKYLEDRNAQLKREQEAIAEIYRVRREENKAAASKLARARILKLLGIVAGIAAVIIGVVLICGKIKNSGLDRLAEEYNAVCSEALEEEFEGHDSVTGVECSVISVEKVSTMSGYYTATVKVELTTNGEGDEFDDYMLQYDVSDAVSSYVFNGKTVQVMNYDATSDYYCQEMLYIYVDGELVVEPRTIK